MMMRRQRSASHARIVLASIVLAASFAVAGCGVESEPPYATKAPEPAGMLAPPSPPLAPGPNYADGHAIASPGEPDIGDLEDAQIDAMFDAAVSQARPGEEKRAICVGIQGLADRAVKDAPTRVIRRLGETLQLPAVPTSECKFDAFPYVAATKANAILYTVKVEARDRHGILTFWATATYGNLGANGAKLRLVRANGRWTAVATGASIVS